MNTSMAPADDPSRTLRELIGTGRFAEAVAWFRGTEGHAVQERPDVSLLAATAATRVGEFDLGQSLAQEALTRFRARADSDGRMRSTNLLGAIAFEHGRLDEAQDAFETVVKLARELDDSLMEARASNNLASIALLRGNAGQSVALGRTALLAHLRLGDRRGAAEAYHNLGIAYRFLRQWQEAEDAAAQAVRHAELVGEPSLLALAMTGRAEGNLHRGEHEVARQELTRCRQLATQAADAIGSAEVALQFAKLGLAEGDFEAARREAEAGRAVAMEHRSVLLQADCAAAAAQALNHLGRGDDARARREEAERLFDSLGARKMLELFDETWGAR